jgi:hypothetical protein
MRKHTRWLMIPIASGLLALVGMGLRGGRAEEPNRPTAEDVIMLWKPM